MIGITLKDFQQNTINQLLNKTGLSSHQREIVLQAPTGSGKTIILISYIEHYLEQNPNTVFIWLCPGNGELEEQSREKMLKYLPQTNAYTLQDALTQGFQSQSTYFINWERITKKGNKAISDTERGNLFDKIHLAHRQGVDFILLIDEEHLHNTAKTDMIIQSFSAKFIIRVSATPITVKDKSKCAKIEINERDVIREELITKTLFINKDLEQECLTLANEENQIHHETDILIKQAIQLRQALIQAYKEEQEKVNPLVLIQFPNMSDELINYVEKQLENAGYTYLNGTVAAWFSDNNGKNNHINLNDETAITAPDAKPCFLLFKQAIATGWDCPRAKILIKLRENMSDNFEIQTIGRLRRMPRGYHYDHDILNHAYIYTFDEKYKSEIQKAGALETKRLFLKNEAKTINLIKQVQNKDSSLADSKKIRTDLFHFLMNQFSLTRDLQKNRQILETYNFKFGTKIDNHLYQGNVIRTDELMDGDNLTSIAYGVEVSPHHHALDLRQTIDRLKSELGLSYENTRAILESYFRESSLYPKNKLLNLSLKEFYAFILNNFELLKHTLRNFTNSETEQYQLNLGEDIKEYNFTIPQEENYRLVDDDLLVEPLNTNVYKDYDSRMISGGLRSTSERLLENYCEQNDNVKFVYKNGDKGIEYYSIAYRQNNGSIKSFYPDYIVQLQNGEIILIETKGGENASGEDKNIDPQAINKFNMIKQFAKAHNYRFAFVRDKDCQLFYSTTEYTDDMLSKDHYQQNIWQPLHELLK